MRAFAFMLGGLVVWTVHFLGVYAIASVADVIVNADAPAARLAIAAFTIACLLAASVIGALAVRRWRSGGDGLDRFIASTAAVGAGLSAVAILWQGLPAIVGH